MSKKIDFKHIGIVLKAFFKDIADTWFVFFSIFGVIILVVAFLFIPDAPDSYVKLKNLLYMIGSAIIVTGTFGSMVRWFTVHGIVKKELENILFGNEYLQKSENFDIVWEKVVNTAINKHMPSLSSLLHQNSLRAYLPKEKELYYKDTQQKFDVYWENQDKRIIKITEETETIIHTNDRSPHYLPYKFTADFPSELKLNYEITNLSIDGNDRISEVEILSEEEEADNLTKIAITYNLKLEGKTEYRLFRYMNRILFLDHEPLSVIGYKWNAYKPRVTIECHETDLKAFFTSTGTLSDFDTIKGKNSSPYMKEEYPGLMMKEQGYVIYFASC